METIILIAIVGTLNVVCFFIGAKVGQTVSKGEAIEMPSVNPIEAIREHNDKREADREQDRLETIMRNIERYDGSANGQEDV
jgi:hypothetical protein